MKSLALTICAIACVVAMPVASVQSPSGALDRIRDAGRIRLGYRGDARPFSYRDASGNAAGYSIALCQRIADAVQAEVRQPSLSIEWVPVAADGRFRAVQQGAVDVLCGADTMTLDRRRQVAFSIPIFPGGIGALLRADAPVRLQDVLNRRGATFHPTWRAAAASVLQARAFATVAGSTAQTWLTSRVEDLQVVTEAITVATYEAGVDAVRARRADALFGERAILLDAARNRAGARDLVVLDRRFTHEPLALALGANDDAFRLVVDRALSRLYVSGELRGVYTTWFGEPDESTVTFFRWAALPD